MKQAGVLCSNTLTSMEERVYKFRRESGGVLAVWDVAHTLGHTVNCTLPHEHFKPKNILILILKNIH